MEPIDLITESLPDGFKFYHLGEIIKQDDSGDPDKALGFLDDSIGVAFSLSGEMKGLFVVVFDQGLDSSTYTELGNVLASRLANNLSTRKNCEVMISSPRLLNTEELTSLTLNAPEGSVSRYIHIHDGKTIPVQTLILAPSLGGANA